MQLEGIHSRQNVANPHELKHRAADDNAAKEFEKLFTETKKEVKGHESKVNGMIDDISKIKEMLDYELTPENLEQYKDALRSFLDYYTKNELKMEEYSLRDQKGYTKKLNVIKSINGKLNEMTENMLETNADHLSQLKRIGEIQGLLVNLRL